MYTYKGKVVKVYDADTITVDIDLGFKIHFTETVRLLRIDAPEIRGIERPEGLVAQKWLSDLILDKEITLITIKDSKGKYGRYLGEIWFEGKNLNDLLVESGHAEYYKY